MYITKRFVGCLCSPHSNGSHSRFWQVMYDDNVNMCDETWGKTGVVDVRFINDLLELGCSTV